MYGFSLLQAPNFAKTTVVGEKHLASIAQQELAPQKETGLPKRVTQLTLLTAMSTPEGPQLLYALTRSNSEARISNLVQMGACILASSKVVFLGTLSKLLSLLDPRKAQLCYTDTDSLLIATHELGLDRCLREGADPAELSALMEDPHSEVHQSGLLKDEGWYTDCSFRSAKFYRLGGRVTDGGELRRVRGVRSRQQDTLPRRVFGVDPITNRTSVRSVALRPTRGFEMTLQEESRTLSHSLNMKRVCQVGC